MNDEARKSPYDEALERLGVVDALLSPTGQDLDHLGRLATLGTLAAGVAHEINNILTPARAYAQLAQEHPGDQALVHKALDRIIAGIDATSAITDCILGSATGDAAGCGTEARADIREVATAAVECLHPRLKKQGIDARLSIRPGVIVEAPEIALRHVLLNLLINACDAMPRGGVITIDADTDSNGRIVIRVADTGTGIDSGIAGRIFEPFIHAAASKHAATRIAGRQRGGSGMGLAVCRYLVLKYGGEISLESSGRQGTTFSISLPSSCTIASEAV